MILATEELLDLYGEVLTEESVKHLLGGSLVDTLTVVRNSYKGLSRDEKNACVDYNVANYRYAYIYYYAVCHTLVVTRQVGRILLKRTTVFCDFMGYEKETLEVCSLGGGPGCDLIGLLRLRGAVGLGRTKRINCSVVDASSGWQHSLKYVLKAYLNSGGGLYRGKLNFELLRSNLLLLPLRKRVVKRVQDADILTLVKFVSAIPAEEASEVLEYIFGLMKPGAYVFFSDNGSGDAYETIDAAAENAGLTKVIPQKLLGESVSNKRLPAIGPQKISLRPLKYTYACYALWKKPGRT